jgi:hypothetical protein
MIYLVNFSGQAFNGGPLGVGIVLGPPPDTPTAQLLHNWLNHTNFLTFLYYYYKDKELVR